MNKDKILVIENDPGSQIMICYHLHEKYDVILANDCEQGLELAKYNLPDLIVTDVAMLKNKGFLLQDKIRKIPELKLIPYIFLTPDISQKDGQNKLMTGADDYLVKPIEPDVLLKKVDLLLERSKVYREESLVQFAEIVNTIFVHSPPEIPDYDINFMLIPAKIGGGDVIDYVKLDDMQYDFIFGDVMGKGIKAKFFAYSFIGYLRGLLYPSILSNQSLGPSSLLSRLSQFMDIDPFLQEVFITLIMMRIDFKKHIFTYTNAGYMPSLYFNVNKMSVQELNTGGGIPGFAFFDYDEEQLSIEPGDFLLFFSDGVTEAKNFDNEMVGIESIKDWIMKNYEKNAQDMSDSILELIQKYSENTLQYDDISISIIKRLR